MNDWNIQSRAHLCGECGNGFEDKQAYRTILWSDEAEYARLDLCDACWEEKYQEGSARPDGFLSAWRGVYQAPPPAPPEAIQKETAEGLLRKLLELNDPVYLNASYILAVMLERKRVLKVKDEFREEGRRILVYEHPKNGDVFTIPDPELQLTELDVVQKQVADLMENGLPSDESQAEESGDAEVEIEDPESEETSEVPDPDHQPDRLESANV
ncbi:MAG: hypothetical protein CMO80_13720 [Verrucomicrobiales bacterium]|nr:hypothetical protein [Verrucomicrobiales bacterium]|tara:strand:- start:4461 stop:5099 length:639 start_codon:yes stop_codon:yes gene_type:complete